MMEQPEQEYRRMMQWQQIVQQWGLDMADPDSPFGILAEKVRRAQFRAQLRVEREARSDKKIMEWWEKLKAERKKEAS